MICPNCGGQIGTSDPSCPHCGASLEEVKKAGSTSSGSRRGFELLVALVAALALAGVIVACSYFLPIYFKGLPSISPILYAKEAGNLYISSDIHADPILISSKLSVDDPQVCMSENGRFIAFVEAENGVKTLLYTAFDAAGVPETKVVETDISNVTITQKGDKVYYCKEGYLFRYENGMNTKLYSAPVTSYRRSDTHSVVLFTCSAASGSAYEDLFLLDFAQNNVAVTPVDTDVTRIDTSLQPKRFSKIVYAKVSQENTYDVYFCENGKSRMLAEKAKDYYVSASGDILFTKSAKNISLSRFVKDDMISFDKANPNDPGAKARVDLRASLKAAGSIPLVDVFLKTGDKQITVCENAHAIAAANMAALKYIVSVPSALKDVQIPLSEIADVNTVQEKILAAGNSSVLYTAGEENAVLCTDETSATSKILPAADWKRFFKLTKINGSDTASLSVIKDVKSGEAILIDTDVSQVIPNAGGKFFYIRDNDLFLYDNEFAKIMATDIIPSSVQVEGDGTCILFIERDGDKNATGDLVSVKGDRRYTLARDVSWFTYRNSQSVYFAIPTADDRYDLYRATDEGAWKLIDRDVFKTIK